MLQPLAGVGQFWPVAVQPDPQRVLMGTEARPPDQGVTTDNSEKDAKSPGLNV